jgi:hypothetical protein
MVESRRGTQDPETPMNKTLFAIELQNNRFPVGGFFVWPIAPSAAAN